MEYVHTHIHTYIYTFSHASRALNIKEYFSQITLRVIKAYKARITDLFSNARYSKQQNEGNIPCLMFGREGFMGTGERANKRS